jgi:hypothetical protein
MARNVSDEVEYFMTSQPTTAGVLAVAKIDVRRTSEPAGQIPC